MSDDGILKLGMSPEELEDTIQFSQQMVQVLLETIGESVAEVDQLRRENRALRLALQEQGLGLPEVVVAPAEEAPVELLPEAPTQAAPSGAAAGEETLPEPAPAPSAEPAAPAAATTTESEAGLGDGVLIVDDSRILQMRLRSLIEPLGFKIAGYATNGAEGVKLALQVNPRCIIMDYNMPVLNGLEAVKVLHRDAPHIRVIICAADLTAATSRELVANGCHELLTKPIQLDHFVRAIKRCMDDKPYSRH